MPWAAVRDETEGVEIYSLQRGVDIWFAGAVTGMGLPIGAKAAKKRGHNQRTRRRRHMGVGRRDQETNGYT